MVGSILMGGKWALNVSLLVRGHGLLRSELVDIGHIAVTSEL